MGVLWAQHDIEAALNHAAAAALAFERLGGDEDFQIRAGVMGIERGHLGGGAHANDQKIGFDHLDHSYANL